MKLPHLLAALCLCTFVLGSAIPLERRGLDDVFPGFDPALPAEPHAEQQHSPEREQPTRLVHMPTTTTPAPSAASSSSSPKSAGTTSHQQSTGSAASSAAVTQVTNSIIGTIPPLPSFTPWSANRPDASTSIQDTSAPTQTPSVSQPSAKGGTSGTQEWKIVGVAVIAFTSVAAILLLSVFFDHWWGFLRDIFWRKNRKDNLEELIPDWKTASWEIRTGSDGRYPTIPPPASMKQVELDLDRARTLPSMGNVAGVGSGYKGDAYNYASPRQEYKVNSPWTPSQGLGLSPLPAVAQVYHQQPPGISGHALRRDNSNRPGLRGSPPSPALTDPYGGIAE